MHVEEIISFLDAMQEKDASDLYLTVGKPPTLRCKDGFLPIGHVELDAETLQHIVKSMLSPRQVGQFEKDMELNVSLNLDSYGRYRINVYKQRQCPALVIRRIVTEIPSFEELHLPPVLKDIAMKKRGLIIFAGMAGAGKSTSMASMIDYRNRNSAGHIITIEDPIEYYHSHRKSIITQREVGDDTHSYAAALKNCLRQRPDVIMVGEIRDREVMEQTLMAAETGHLCLATIHTNNVGQAIERMINLFPSDYANQVRINLSMNLVAIVSQKLVPTLDGNIRPVLEIMLNQGFVKEMIATGQLNKVHEVIENNVQEGMCTFDQSLISLYRDGVISEEVMLRHAEKMADIKIKVRDIEARSGSGREQSKPDINAVPDSIQFSE